MFGHRLTCFCQRSAFNNSSPGHQISAQKHKSKPISDKNSGPSHIGAEMRKISVSHRSEEHQTGQKTTPTIWDCWRLSDGPVRPSKFKVRIRTRPSHLPSGTSRDPILPPLNGLSPARTSQKIAPPAPNAGRPGPTTGHGRGGAAHGRRGATWAPTGRQLPSRRR